MKSKTFIKLITILCVCTSIQAEKLESANNTQLEIDTSYASYVRMTTEELQVALEKLSLNGEHHLEMGLELIKRWTTES